MNTPLFASQEYLRNDESFSWNAFSEDGPLAHLRHLPFGLVADTFAAAQPQPLSPLNMHSPMPDSWLGRVAKEPLVRTEQLEKLAQYVKMQQHVTVGQALNWLDQLGRDTPTSFSNAHAPALGQGAALLLEKTQQVWDQVSPQANKLAKDALDALHPLRKRLAEMIAPSTTSTASVPAPASSTAEALDSATAPTPTPTSCIPPTAQTPSPSSSSNPSPTRTL